MESSSTKNLEDCFNRIWVQGTDQEKEDAQEALLALCVDLGMPHSDFECDDTRALSHCLQLIRNKTFRPTPEQLQSLESCLKSLDHKIANARERDITLI